VLTNDRQTIMTKHGNSFFDVKSSIKKKLIITFVFILLLISFIVSLASFYIAKNELDSQGKIILQNSVNMTLMLIDAKNGEVKRGVISLEEAQEQVKTYILGKATETGKTIEVIYNQNGDKKTIKEIKRPINKELLLGKNGYSIVYSQDGMEIAHPSLEGNNIWNLKEKGKTDGVYVVREQIKAGLKPGGDFVTYSWTMPNSDTIGEKITFQRLDPNWGWIVVAGTYMSDFNEGANKIIYMSAIAILFSLLLGIIMALTVINRITSPIKAMVAFSEELSAGDFSDKPRTVNRRDELGQLADSLTNMRTNVNRLIRNAQNSAEQIAAASEQLTASAEQSAQAASQVASAIIEVANGASKQLNATNETFSVVEIMSASIQQVAANTNEVADQSVRAAEKASSGGKTVEQAVMQMKAIEESTQGVAESVGKLSDQSKEIGQIVDVISDIAGQTNLLALNAAIEAARAGEQGRGFAVVAEEVRKLAEQSQVAAKQIADLIGQIQTDTAKAVSAMNGGAREVQLGTQVVNTAGESFNEIASLVTNISEQVKEISVAVHHMAGSSQTIVSTVKDIDELSKNASEEAQTVSAATQEQTASMEEIASSSHSLAKLAEELQETVNKFKV